MLAALAATSRDNEQSTRVRFSLDAFCAAHPALSGLLLPSVASTIGLADLVVVEDDDGEIYSIFYDVDDTKTIKVSLATPPGSKRCAAELLNAVHFAALARDNAKTPPADVAGSAQMLEVWFVEQERLVAAEQVVAGLATEAYLNSSEPLRAAADGDECEARLRALLAAAFARPFSPAPPPAAVDVFLERILSVWRARLLQPVASVVLPVLDDIVERCPGVLTAQLPIAEPCCAAGGATSAQLRWGAYFAAVELPRWRLIRSAVDGNVAASLRTAARDALKRLVKLNRIAVAIGAVVFADLTPSCQGYFADAECANSMLSMLQRIERGDDGEYSCQQRGWWEAIVRCEVVLLELERAKQSTAGS